MTRAAAVVAALATWAGAEVGRASAQSDELGRHVLTSLARVAEGFGLAGSSETFAERPLGRQ